VIQEKVWGTTETLYKDALTWLTQINVVQGGFSSKHHHETLYNGFVVVSGSLLLLEYDNSGKEHRIVLVPQAHGYKFAPMMPHKFEALEDTVAREIYWPKAGYAIDVGDIVRQDTGGVQ
jgi:hypothetical protein